MGDETPSPEKPSLDFKGLMVPVFTSFNDDNKRSVQADNIDKYATFLKAKGVQGVLVNGTTGEGPVLSLEEKKLVTEQWAFAAGINDLVRIVQVGGAPIPDVLEMTRFTESLGVDGILCLPDLYFKPKSEEALVQYLTLVSKSCPDTALLYYHIPKLVGSNFDMPKFCDLAEVAISNFVGIVYASNDLEMGSACLKPGRHVFLESDALLLSALVLGFDSAIMTSLNIYPEIPLNIVEHMKNGRIQEAQEAQSTLNAHINQILKDGNSGWVMSMKKSFNSTQTEQPDGIFAGPVRCDFSY